MRSRLIFFTFLAAATTSATGSAQSILDRCAQLQAEEDKLDRESSIYVDENQKPYWGYVEAIRRLEALEGSRGHLIHTLLLEEEPYTVSGMSSFREKHGLSAQLAGFARAGNALEFWRGATVELLRAFHQNDERLDRLSEKMFSMGNERMMLGCFSLSKPPDSPRPPSTPPEVPGPLPVDRRPDGEPIVTDALITRWIRARYAQTVGGAYWQAGRMTAQDFVDVARRMQSYLDLLRSGGAASKFSDDEMRAINARWPDIENTIQGNWSRVNLQ